MSTQGNEIGVIGLSVMGANLAMNIADHGFAISVYNRSREKTDNLKRDYTNNNMTACYSLGEFVDSLSAPRKIILMIEAGNPVDLVIEQLKPLLQPGDIIVDGGNSFFQDTKRREKYLIGSGINFVGMGVSGGEEGARKGPAIMPGGSEMAWNALAPILQKIAAKDFAGNPCVTHIGPDGAGHYVKMVHNGIEYIDMQLIAETYWLMKNVLGLDNESIATQFEIWNQGRLNSFLIEITAKILRKKDTNGGYVLDTILDSAGNKGTGKWTSIESLNLGVPSFGFIGAVLARYASAHKERRLAISSLYSNQEKTTTEQISFEQLESALYVSKILAYAQGYELLFFAGQEYEWNLNFSQISSLWQGGCIIRAEFLQKIAQVFTENKSDKNMIETDYFRSILQSESDNLRKVIIAAIKSQMPMAAMMAGLVYFDSMKSDRLPANLLQAQRDFFGAHTFQTEINGQYFHHQWE
jgi:6-phosphogluconate dehydrogenase